MVIVPSLLTSFNGPMANGELCRLFYLIFYMHEEMCGKKTNINLLLVCTLVQIADAHSKTSIILWYSSLGFVLHYISV